MPRLAAQRLAAQRLATQRLADQQDWLRLAVTTPGGAAAGLEIARRRYGDGHPLRARPGVDPLRGLSIYARGYLERLLACMRADYPAVRALVGDALFDRFATGYVWTHPPRHPSLFALGAAFADYLAATRPPDHSVPDEYRSFLRLPSDLARAERARLEASRAPGWEEELGVRVEPTGPAKLFGDARSEGACSKRYEPTPSLASLLADGACVAAPPCVRIVQLGHDVRAFIAAVDRREAPAAPDVRPTVLAASRVDYRPVLTELSPWQASAVSAAATPRPLAALAEEVAAASGQDTGSVLADLALWLPTAAGLGLLARFASSTRADPGQF